MVRPGPPSSSPHCPVPDVCGLDQHESTHKVKQGRKGQSAWGLCHSVCLLVKIRAPIHAMYKSTLIFQCRFSPPSQCCHTPPKSKTKIYEIRVVFLVFVSQVFRESQRPQQNRWMKPWFLPALWESCRRRSYRTRSTTRRPWCRRSSASTRAPCARTGEPARCTWGEQ